MYFYHGGGSVFFSSTREISRYFLSSVLIPRVFRGFTRLVLVRLWSRYADVVLTYGMYKFADESVTVGLIV